ncbi:MAG: septal ring lytic transglycosylase RlpA family protein [Rickettsiaceae bacterium H1]|nr:septal ring lytic transglycosylase RlpA family protein [Rickettsiaceae bacterium H1]
MLLCTACSNSVHNQYKGKYRIGSMYTIDGENYYPQYYNKYEELGVASWYEEKCDKCLSHNQCKPCVTANGELFDKNSLTAAHRTLPMPSIVRVTNLNNGKIVRLKINDRGPFKNDRILDVTERAAKELGFKENGLAMVKVEYLKRATEKLIHSKPHYKKTYRKIMDEISKRSSIFSPNVTNKLDLKKGFRSPDLKKMEKAEKQKLLKSKKVNSGKLLYDPNTGYKKSSRYKKYI